MFISFDKTFITDQIAEKANKINRLPNYRRESLERRVLEARPPNINDDLINQFRLAFDQVLVNLDQQIGNLFLWNSPGDNFQPKEKALSHLLKVSIQCCRRSVPAKMSIQHLISLLAKYSFHAADFVRFEAFSALMGFLISRPSLRNILVAEFARSILSIPENNVDILIHHGLENLLKLLYKWFDPSVLRCLDPDMDEIKGLSERSAIFPSSILEAVALVFLGHHQPAVRTKALELAEIVYRLGLVVGNDENASSPSRLFTVIQKQSSDIAQKSKKNPTTAASIFTNSIIEDNNIQVEEEVANFGSPNSFFDILTLSTGGLPTPPGYPLEEQQLRWSKCLGELVKALDKEGSKATGAAFCMVCDRFEATHSVISKKSSVAIASEQLVLWRNYLVLMIGIAAPNSEIVLFQTGSTSFGSIEYNLDWIVKRLAVVITSPTPQIRDAIQLAFRFCSKGHITEFVDGLTLHLEKKKSKNQVDQIRVEIGRIYATLSEIAESQHLFDHNAIFRHFLEFVEDSLATLQSFYSHSMPPDLNAIQMARSLHVDFLRTVALCLERMSPSFQRSSLAQTTRENLLTFSMQHCGFGAGRTEHKGRIQTMRQVATEKTRSETDERDFRLNQLKIDIANIELWSLRVIGGILRDPIVGLPEDLLKGTGPIMTCVIDIFERTIMDETACLLGQSIVRQLLSNNQEQQELLFRFCVDRSFSYGSPSVVQGFFKTIAEMIVVQGVDVSFRLPVLLSLSLFKMLDTASATRHQASKLLHWMSSRFFRTRSFTFQLMPFSQTPQLYYKDLRSVAQHFSDKHPELRMEILEEIMYRVAIIDKESQQKLLFLLAAWTSRFDLNDLDEDAQTLLLRSLLCFSVKLGSDPKLSDQIHKMWADIASSNTSNIGLVFDFLFDFLSERQHAVLLDACYKITGAFFSVDAKITLSYLLAKVQEERNATFEDEENDTNFWTYSNGPFSIPSNAALPNNLSNCWDLDKLFPLGEAIQPPAAEPSQRSGSGIRNTTVNASSSYLSVMYGSSPLNHSTSSSSSSSSLSSPPPSLSPHSSSSPNLNTSASSSSSLHLSSGANSQCSNSDNPMTTKLLTKEELAFLMMTDVANTNEVLDLEIGAKVIHTCLLNADNHQTIIYQTAKTILQGTVCKIILESQKENSTSARAYQELATALSLSGIRPLWNRECFGIGVQAGSQIIFDTRNSQLQQIVRLVFQTLNFSAEFVQQWSSEALKRACQSGVPGTIVRSLQIYRSLQQPLDSDALHMLINKLYLSITVRKSLTDTRIPIELMSTLFSAIKGCPRERLPRLPKLFWVSVAMLHSVITQEFIYALSMLQILVDILDFSDPDLRTLIHALLPKQWNPSFRGLAPLLLKGMCCQATEKPTTNLLRSLCTFPCPQLLITTNKLVDSDATDGTDTPQEPTQGLHMLCILIGLLPQLCTAMANGVGASIALDLASGFQMVGLDRFAVLLSQYPKLVTSAEGLRRYVLEITQLIVQTFFPDQQTFVLTTLIAMLEQGSKEHEKALLMIISSVIKAMDPSLHTALTSKQGIGLFGPLGRYLDGPMWKDTVQVVEVLLSKFPIQRAITDRNQEVVSQYQKFSNAWHFFGHLSHNWSHFTTSDHLLGSVIKSLLSISDDHSKILSSSSSSSSVIYIQKPSAFNFPSSSFPASKASSSSSSSSSSPLSLPVAPQAAPVFKMALPSSPRSPRAPMSPRVNALLPSSPIRAPNSPPEESPPSPSLSSSSSSLLSQVTSPLAAPPENAPAPETTEVATDTVQLRSKKRESKISTTEGTPSATEETKATWGVKPEKRNETTRKRLSQRMQNPILLHLPPLSSSSSSSDPPPPPSSSSSSSSLPCLHEDPLCPGDLSLPSEMMEAVASLEKEIDGEQARYTPRSEDPDLTPEPSRPLQIKSFPPPPSAFRPNPPSLSQLPPPSSSSPPS